MAGVPAWTTYRHDGARSGIDPDSASAVAPTQAWQSGALDGAVWGQPLVYGSRVYVVTESDSVYALDAGSGAIVWKTTLAQAVAANVLCGGDITPTVGITSTPVVDPSNGRIYVVADTWDGGHTASIAHELYALNLSDGSIAVGPVPVDPSGSIPADQLQRASLALDAGNVIIGYGGNDSDCGSYHGWLVAAPENGTGSLQTFEVSASSSGGAIWGAGNAPAIDSAGNIWSSTGNSPGGSPFGYQESVVKLDSNLNISGFWAPANWQNLDSGDTDLGSSMPVLLPDGLVFEIGKQGVGYLLDASSLTGAGGAPVYSHSVCGGSWGGAIYVNGVIYVSCSSGLRALSLDTSTKTFAPLSGWIVNSSAVGPPIYAGGLVWSVGTSVGASNPDMFGLNPATGATGEFSANLNGFEHFTTPSAGGGMLFVANHASGADEITAFRIANTPPPSSTSVGVSSSANPVATAQTVTLTAAVSPSPDGGTVAFADGGAPIAGCLAVQITPAGDLARCTTRFSSSGAHSVRAAYSGDSYYLSSSGSLIQNVTPSTALVISHVRARVVHRKLRLKLTLSEPATLKLEILKLQLGRLVRHRCRTGASHGRRCQVLHRRQTIRLFARAGRHRLRPHMRALPPGRYAVILTAIGANGDRSKAITVLVGVKRPAHPDVAAHIAARLGLLGLPCF